MAVLATLCILAAIAVPRATATIERSQALDAARYFKTQLMLARSRAVVRSVMVSLRFQQDARGFFFTVFADGNGNGVRTAEIDAGIDRPVEGPTRVSDMFPSVDIAMAADGSGDPVQIGLSNLLSFSPLGTATSGSIYLRGRDGSRFTVRVWGVTARARLLRYVPARDEWVDAL